MALGFSLASAGRLERLPLAPDHPLCQWLTVSEAGFFEPPFSDLSDGGMNTIHRFPNAIILFVLELNNKFYYFHV